MKQWIRWPGLIAFAVITAALAAFYLLLAGPLIKMALESFGSQANGAKVDVESVSLSFNPIGLQLQGVAVTDARQPLRNALVFDHAVAELELAPLWLGKGIVRELSIEGLRFGTARSESGALPDVPETAPEAATEDSGGMLSTVELPTADDILARETLTTETLGNALQENYAGHKARIDSSLQAVPDEQALKAYEAEVKALTSGKIASLDDFRQRKAKLDELKARFKADQQALQAARTAISTGRKELSADVQALRAAPAADLKNLREKYRFDATGAANVSALLFGPEAGEWATQALYWYEKIKPYLASDASKDAAAAAAAQPVRNRDGRFVHFPSADPWPQFLLREARIQAQLDAGTMLIQANDITHQQPVLGRPAVVVANSANMAAIDDLTLELTLDHRTAPGRDSLVLAIKDWQPKALDLGVGSARLDSSRVQVNARAVVVGAQLDASGRADFNDARFASEGKTLFARELGSALAGINQFRVDAGASGRLSSPSVNLSSDLDKQLSKAFDRRLQQKQDELEAELKAKLQQKLQQQLGDYAAELEQLQQLEGSLEQRLSQLGDMAATQLDDYADQQKREAEAKAKAEADARKKELESKAKDKLKKLF
ncbi:TIGR03545 family protein [Oceanospirillaceae bacterium ASx5O]|nr:TIGR03545 family protein [Oceanospirillaceae bacterium ASx5O]